MPDFIRVTEIAQQHLNAMFNDIKEELMKEAQTSTLPLEQVPVAPTPTSWKLIEQRKGEEYSWPELLEKYDPFDVYEGELPDRRKVYYAIGHCERYRVWGRDRLYKIVFLLGSNKGSKQPICEFLETDQHDETGEFVAIVRGKGGPRGQRMFDPDDELPSLYKGMPTGVYRDLIEGTPGFTGWNKQAVVARNDDHETMLRHAFNQVTLRHLDAT